MSLPMKILLVYLLLVNVIAFIMYGADKQKAKHDKWRIPEATLILWAVIGGSFGALAGMMVLHHKTKKPRLQLICRYKD